MKTTSSTPAPGISLAQLAGVLSQCAEDLIHYYDCLINALDQVPWGAGPAEVFIEPEVLTARTAGFRAVVQPEPAASPGRAKPVRWSSPRFADWSPLEAIMGARDERERDPARRHARRWNQEFRPRPRLRRVVLGAPGGGKTYATRATVVRLAREAQALLRAGRELPETVIVPVWIPAAAMVGQNSGSPGAQLLRCLEANPYWAWGQTPLAGDFRTWLEQRLVSDAGFVVIDALDEAGNQGRSAVTVWLGAVRRESVPVVLTCRTMDWRNGVNRTVDWARRDERLVVELARCDRVRQEIFLRELLLPALAQSVIDRLQGCDGLEHICGSSLLLAFAAWLGNSGKLTAEVTAFSLFSQMIYEILRGEWRTKTGPKQSAAPDEPGRNPTPDEILFLQRLCWRIFQLNLDQDGNRFSDAMWYRAWEAVAAAHPAGGGKSAQELWHEMHHLGLIQSDKREATPELGEPVWHFSHYVLFEFLAACGWCAWEEDYHLLLEGNEVVSLQLEDSGRISERDRRNPFWFRAQFQQVLLFVAGRLRSADAVRRLLAAVERERDDVFYQILDWRLRILSAATCRDPGSVLEDCARRVVDDWWLAWHGGRRHARAWLAEPLRDLAGRSRQMLLRRLRQGLVPTARRHPRLMLTRQLPGSPAEPILKWFDLSFQSNLSADLIVRLGDCRLVADLEDLLRTECIAWGWASGGISGRLQVIHALAGLRAESSARRLLEKFTQPDLPAALRKNIAAVLGEFRFPWMGQALVDLLKAEKDSLFVRRALIQSLGRLADPATADFLRTFLQEQTSDTVRLAIGDALSALRDAAEGIRATAAGPAESAETLLERLVTGEVWERRDAAKQLERREDQALTAPTVEAFLTEGNAEVRAALAFAIEQCIDPVRCDGMIARLRAGGPAPADRASGGEDIRFSDRHPPIPRPQFESWMHALDVHHLALRLARIKGDADWLEQQYRLTVASNTSPESFFTHLAQARKIGNGRLTMGACMQVQFEAAMNALTRAWCVKQWAATPGDEDRTDQLLEWLRQEQEPFVRREIVAALGECRKRRALDAIRDHQKSLVEWSYLTMFVDGLGRYQDPEALGFSIALLLAQRSDVVLASLWKVSMALGFRVPRLILRKMQPMRRRYPA